MPTELEVRGKVLVLLAESFVEKDRYQFIILDYEGEPQDEVLLWRKVVAELEAEGSIETRGKRGSAIRFTATGYDKYKGHIAAFRAFKA